MTFWQETKQPGSAFGQYSKPKHKSTGYTDRTGEPPANNIPLSNEKSTPESFESAGTVMSHWADASTGGPPLDAQAKLKELAALSAEARHKALLDLRKNAQWETFLSQLKDEDVTVVQAWLSPECRQGPAPAGTCPVPSLEERLATAHNSDRGKDAMQRVDAVAAKDRHQPPRITARLRELLVLGVAMPKLVRGAKQTDSDYLSQEGILGAVQAERAAQALVAMPAQEYIRTLALIDLSGDASRQNQSYLLLKGVAARLDQLTNADKADDSLKDLDGFADATRDMTDDELVEKTSVTQTKGGGRDGLQQRFTMSCNVTSALVVRAEADPLEALKINQTDQLSMQQLQGDVSAQTEASLEHPVDGAGKLTNVAVARDTSRVTAAINGAVTALAATAPIDELLAVNNYISRVAYDPKAYAAGIQKIRAHLNQGGFPDDQAMRLVREADSKARQDGMTPTELQNEMNGSLGVNKVTGRNAAVDWDSALWTLYTAGHRLIPTPLPASWTTRIDAMLTRAAATLESGIDTTFNVYWDGSGGHTMTFTDVRTVSGQRTFLVHDTWTGKTAWVPEGDIQQGSWPGIAATRGVLCGLIG